MGSRGRRIAAIDKVPCIRQCPGSYAKASNSVRESKTPSLGLSFGIKRERRVVNRLARSATLHRARNGGVSAWPRRKRWEDFIVSCHGRRSRLNIPRDGVASRETFFFFDNSRVRLWISAKGKISVPLLPSPNGQREATSVPARLHTAVQLASLPCLFFFFLFNSTPSLFFIRRTLPVPRGRRRRASPIAILLVSASQSQSLHQCLYLSPPVSITRHCSCAHFLPYLENKRGWTEHCCRCSGQPTIPVLFCSLFLIGAYPPRLV